jgi:hypothetical protein
VTLVAVPETYVDLDDRVLILLTRKGRMSDGAEFSEAGAAMYIFEDGQMRRMELYAERASALESVGLTEAEAVERGVPVSEAKP